MALARIAWSWRNAAYGSLLALPAAVVAIFVDPGLGVPLGIGVLPAAALGLQSSRRARFMTVVVGTVAGVSIFLGSLVASHPVLAIVTVFALCVGVALFAADPAHRLGMLALTLGLPLYGAGLSESSWSAGFTVGMLVVAGSAYGWLVSLAWPAGPDNPRGIRPSATRSSMLVYGLQLGVAGSLTIALGFALGVDHPGWACTAALLVSRPDRTQLDARSWGRVISVTGGALIACALALTAPTAPVLALIVLLTLTAAAGTAGSRWYVFPFFSTLLVLSVLLLDETVRPAHWFLERTGLTLLGVAIALASAWAIPAIARRVGGRSGVG